MNIVLVTHDSPYSRCLAAGLAEASVVDKIIVEYGRPSRRFYLGKLKKVGIVNFVFQYFLNSWFKKQGAAFLRSIPMPEHIAVDNVNRYALDSEDLIIGFGTSYITRRTLKKLKHGFLNVHTGVLPKYRGVKSEFWTLYNRDYRNAGWTLHFMSPNIDEGDIIRVSRVSYDGENPAELRARIIEDAIPTLVEIIKKVKAEGTDALARQKQGPGEYFSTPTFSQWRRYRRSCKKSGLQ